MTIGVTWRGAAAAVLALAVLVPRAAEAQTPRDAPAAFFIEGGGNGLYYSLNYEARLNSHLLGRVGFTFLNMTVFSEESGEDSEVALTLMPVMVNGLIGRGSARLELGAGPLIALTGTGLDRLEQRHASLEFSDDLSIAGITSAIGFRYHPRQGGFLFRATVTPFYSRRPQVWGGVSVGWVM